jgi:hypothetical protein
MALGVLGGFSFALNNVMLRREAARSAGARALAMFLGGAVVSAALLALSMAVALPPAAGGAGWLVGTLALALVFLGGNLALQYGAARLPANATAVIMITEVLFASGSAVLLGAGSLTPALARRRADRAGLAAGGARLTSAASQPAGSAPWPNRRSTTSKPCRSTASRRTCPPSAAR